MKVKGAKILIIDDIESHLLLLKNILDEDGYEVHTIKESTKALKEIEENRYDLILLDLIMPEINGFQLLDEINNDRLKKSTPIIVLSSKSDSKSIINSIKKGAIDYIVKPVNIRDLKNKIKSALSQN